LKFIGTSQLVAHNAAFDRAFVQHELGLLGMPFANPWYCTLQLSRRQLPRLFNHRLETVYRHLFGGLPEEVQRHRALDDARMAARVWIELGS
jgi:DNA polymerase-3 subunit epsilon